MIHIEFTIDTGGDAMAIVWTVYLHQPASWRLINFRSWEGKLAGDIVGELQSLSLPSGDNTWELIAELIDACRRHPNTQLRIID